MARKEKSEYIIQAVSHAPDLLEQFHDDVDEPGVTELNKRPKRWNPVVISSRTKPRKTTVSA